MISEVKFVTLSVAHLDRTARFYQQAFGYHTLGRHTIAGEHFERAWRMPAGLTGDALVLGPAGKQSGLLRLVQFDRPGVRIWGNYERLQDLWHYAVNFRYRSIAEGWPRLLAAGGIKKSEPFFWKVNDDLEAWDSQAFDPDGVLLDVFEVGGNLDATIGRLTEDASEVQSVAIHVADAARSSAFYQGLGFSVLFDTMLEHMGAFLGTADDVRVHNINFVKKELTPNGRLEIAQYIGADSQSLYARAAPPNYGILSVTLETDDIDQALRQIINLGGTVIAPPGGAEMPPFGAVRSAMAAGPDSEALELFQRRSLPID